MAVETKGVKTPGSSGGSDFSTGPRSHICFLKPPAHSDLKGKCGSTFTHRAAVFAHGGGTGKVLPPSSLRDPPLRASPAHAGRVLLAAPRLVSSPSAPCRFLAGC